MLGDGAAQCHRPPWCRDVSTSSEDGGAIESSGDFLRLNSGGASLPHPAKVRDDAWLLCKRCTLHRVRPGNRGIDGAGKARRGWPELTLDGVKLGQAKLLNYTLFVMLDQLFLLVAGSEGRRRRLLLCRERKHELCGGQRRSGGLGHAR